MSNGGRDETDPSSAEFFDRQYAVADDPWNFATSPYELGRYQAVLDHVDPTTHRRVFEPGCSIGVLTEQLGRRCQLVHATDISALAVQRARARCAHLPGVSIEVGTLAPSPGPPYDLVVVSEVGYYYPLPELQHHIRTLAGRIRPAGRLIAVHWLGHSPDHVLHGDEVQRCISEVLMEWRLIHHDVRWHSSGDGYRMDVWDRT
ncbi:MAG: SAM-dependent methyltransferase [Acidimicrobiales bacterium]